MTLQEYRAKQAEKFIRQNAKKMRDEFWREKQRQAIEPANEQGIQTLWDTLSMRGYRSELSS